MKGTGRLLARRAGGVDWRQGASNTSRRSEAQPRQRCVRWRHGVAEAAGRQWPVPQGRLRNAGRSGDHRPVHRHDLRADRARHFAHLFRPGHRALRPWGDVHVRRIHRADRLHPVEHDLSARLRDGPDRHGRDGHRDRARVLPAPDGRRRRIHRGRDGHHHLRIRHGDIPPESRLRHMGPPSPGRSTWTSARPS